MRRSKTDYLLLFVLCSHSVMHMHSAVNILTIKGNLGCVSLKICTIRQTVARQSAVHFEHTAG